MKIKHLLVTAAIGCGLLTASCSSEVDSDAKSMAELMCNLNKVDKSIDSLQTARLAIINEYQEKLKNINTSNPTAVSDIMAEMKEKGDGFKKLDDELSQKRDIADDKADLLRKQLKDKYRDRDEDKIKFQEKLLELSKDCK